MKQFFLIIILSGSFFLSVINGQPGEVNSQVTLQKLFGRLQLYREDTDRLRINDSINNVIESFVRSDSVFSYNFSGLKFLGQISSPDSRFKIVTWNLLLTDTISRYFCYFILNSGKENKIFNLTTDYKEDRIRTDTIYTDKNWYGSLYYDLRPLKKEYKGSWMLLGIDYGNPSITRKIIDVLTFTPDGGIIFGKKLFETEKEIKFREVLEYSSDAVISLRFISDKKIVFDHLVPMSPGVKDNREYYVPDFSYDVYNFEKDMWKLSFDEDIRNKK